MSISGIQVLKVSRTDRLTKEVHKQAALENAPLFIIHLNTLRIDGGLI